MEKKHQNKIISHVLEIITIICLAIASFSLCIICEFKKTKKKALRVDGELCYLPPSEAFGYGIAGLMCFSISQIIGTVFFIICRRSSDFKSSSTYVASILVSLSWTSFLIAEILIGTTISMNQRQAYGEGWLDGKCYLVKDGVYVGSGILVLIAMSSILFSCYLTLNRSEVVQAQVK